MNADMTKAIIAEMVDDYNLIYRELGFIPEVQARVRSSNGLFVELCRLKDYAKTVAEKGANGGPPMPPQIAPAQVPKAPPRAAEVPAKKAEDAPESIPSPGTKPTAKGEPLATERQIEGIRKFCGVPRLKGFVAETLRAKGKGNAAELTVSEASELIAKLYELKGRVPKASIAEEAAKA